ncbi:MAG: DUF2269 family protein [Calditrichaeota bacterium]|nr:MAG: DUF2269 family protein [Calditrichota bacterium]
MLFNVVKLIHLLSVIFAVGTFIVQFFVLVNNFRSEETPMRRASENIAVDVGKYLGLPGLLLALLSGLALLFLNPSYFYSGFSLHAKILLVVFVFGSSHVAHKRLKNIKAAAKIQDEVAVNANKKQAKNLFVITGSFFILIVYLIVIKPF